MDSFGTYPATYCHYLPVIVGREPTVALSVAIEDFTYMARGMGSPAIETCINIGRVVAECKQRDIPYRRIARQTVKGKLGIHNARAKRTAFSGKRTEVDAAIDHAMQVRGIDTFEMTRDHLAAIAVAFVCWQILDAEKFLVSVNEADANPKGLT